MTISRPRACGLAVLIACMACAAPAVADEPADELSAADAGSVLDTAEATVAPAEAPAGAEPATDATIALHDLAIVYPELGGADRGRADSLLARPTDGGSDPQGDGYPLAAPIASAESPHFCVFWVNAPGFQDAPDLTDLNGVADGDGTPDYVESLLQIAEYSYSVEVAPGKMGWKPPKPDKTGCGTDPSARTDIYLKQLGNRGLFGYETVDPGQGRTRSEYAYLVLDNDYSQAEYGYDDPAIPASVTLAHEFNHVLQMNYDTFQDVWFLEATATWSEEQVYPGVNDYLGYVNSFAKFPGEPITSTYNPSDDRSLRIYGDAVWNHWLDTGGGGYGSDVIRQAWELSDTTKPADFALSAYDAAIKKAGGKSFSREFVPFTAATAEWRAGTGNFPDHASYPDVAREGSLGKGGSKRFDLDHTAYRLLDIHPGGGAKLKLRVKVDPGVRAGLALVARDGDALSGSVTQKVAYLSKGGKGSVTLSDPGRFERITAVVVNADDREGGFAFGDWVYSKDNASFTARLTG
ncbi:MAG: hypothetical protein QOI10_1320 [Solirubrobacterales bacterium]|nr:hypothetical protein [Solirubrobacterales bacterium]